MCGGFGFKDRRGAVQCAAVLADGGVSVVPVGRGYMKAVTLQVCMFMSYYYHVVGKRLD